MGVLCQHCCYWWCRPSHSHCHSPHCAILVLLLARAVALLAHHCPVLESLSLITVSTRNPPYEQGLIGMGQVQPHSFLSPSPPLSLFLSQLYPMSGCGILGCGGVAIVSWGLTPHTPAVTTKENISYLTKKKKKIPSAMQMMAAIICTCLWMGVGCPVSATITNNSSYPRSQRKAPG